MKKFAKLSLAASIVIASSSCAFAQDLESAIKNVEVSGTVTYRYNDYENSNTENNYKAAINLKSKVNDDVTANVRLVAGDGNGQKTLNTYNEGDKNLSVVLSEVNFAYTGLANSTIVVGKQAIDTPFTMARDSIGSEHTGTGIVASTNLGPVNLTGAYFNQTNFNSVNDFSAITFDGSENAYFVGASLNIANTNIDASYIDVEDTFDAYTVGLSANYAISDIKLNSFARYSALDLDDANTDNSLFKVGVGAKMGIFGANVSYGQTDKEGGIVALDGSSNAGMDEHWRVTLTGEKDASVIYASVDAQVLPKLNVALKYSGMDRASNQTDLSEIYVQTTYKMSSNLLTYVRFGQYDNEVDESMSGRLHVQYSF